MFIEAEVQYYRTSTFDESPIFFREKVVVSVETEKFPFAFAAQKIEEYYKNDVIDIGYMKILTDLPILVFPKDEETKDINLEEYVL